MLLPVIDKLVLNSRVTILVIKFVMLINLRRQQDKLSAALLAW